MNEYDDINLSADFDDLSKHAPLLEKIRAKGDGFVVPENYFDEALPVLSGQPAVDSWQSEVDDGFVVPENYFEELAERIIAVVTLSNTTGRQLPAADCLSVPEGYFKKLTDDILAIAQLSDLKTGESFEIPISYFNELDETINTKLALDNLKQDEGFTVPSTYFDNFSDKILTHIAVDELGKGSDADVPQGYFDTLADRISGRIAEEEDVEPEKTIERGRLIVFAEVLKRYARPVAASVALIISVSIWFFNRGEEKDRIAKVIPQKQNVQPVIPAPKKDSVNVNIQPQNNVVVQPKNKKPKVNLTDNLVVQEVDSKDVLEQLYMFDENMVADYITAQDPEINGVPKEKSLDEEMLDYLLNNDADPSDINK